MEFEARRASQRVSVKRERERENRVKLGVSAASHASPNRATAKSFRFRPQHYRTDYHDYHHHNHFISPLTIITLSHHGS